MCQDAIDWWRENQQWFYGAGILVLAEWFDPNHSLMGAIVGALWRALTG